MAQAQLSCACYWVHAPWWTETSAPLWKRNREMRDIFTFQPSPQLIHLAALSISGPGRLHEWDYCYQIQSQECRLVWWHQIQSPAPGQCNRQHLEKKHSKRGSWSRVIYWSLCLISILNSLTSNRNKHIIPTLLTRKVQLIPWRYFLNNLYWKITH